MAQTGALELVLWSTDIDGLVRFLSEVGRLTVVARHPGFAELDAGGATVVVHDDEALRGHPWFDALRKEGVVRGIGAEVRLRVSDPDEAYRAALRLGGLAIMPPYDLDGGRECQVMGPDGYLFTFWG